MDSLNRRLLSVLVAVPTTTNVRMVLELHERTIERPVILSWKQIRKQLRCESSVLKGERTQEVLGPQRHHTMASSRSAAMTMPMSVKKRKVARLGTMAISELSCFDGVGKVSLLVGADTTVVGHKEDCLMQKDALLTSRGRT
ncbi:hypothetical protein BHM03_00060922, partial [Ensete ventricosum]